jgi:carnitine O-octanoyltransferase
VKDESLDIEVSYFTEYGKDYIRSFKLHPDTFVQMALQLAYYRMYNK